jgi:cell division protein FtsZ
LLQAVRGISQIITEPGLINVDFADVRTIMAEMGMAMMGAGLGRGDARSVDAANAAISSPLLEDISIGGAHGVLVNITASPDFGIQEMNDAVDLIQNQAHEDANIIFGLVHDEALDDEVEETVAAAPAPARPAAKPAGVPQRLPLIDDSDMAEDPAPGRRLASARADREEADEEREEMAFAEETGDAGSDEAINIPAYLRRWKNRRRNMAT